MKKGLKFGLLCGLLGTLCGALAACNQPAVGENSGNAVVPETPPVVPESSVESESSLSFYELDDGTYGVGSSDKTRYLTKITIPSTYKGKKVTQIVDQAFLAQSQLESVEIPASVTKIGEQAFAYSENLNGVTYDGKAVSLYSVYKYTYTDMPVEIADYAFDYTGFEQLSFEDSWDGDTLVDVKYLNPSDDVVSVKITPKLNGVTDMYATANLSVYDLMQGTEVDFGTYGLFKNTEIEFVKKSGQSLKHTVSGVSVTADHYNFMHMNGTYPVLVASLKMDEITENGSVPTFVSLERKAAYDWDQLPENVRTMPFTTKQAATTGMDFHGVRAGISAYIKELYELNPSSHFSLYIVDNYNELILEYLVANGIPESNWNAVLLSDGAGTAGNLSAAYGVENPTAKHEQMMQDWENLKEYFFKKGSYDLVEDGQYIHDHLVAPTSNVYEILRRYPFAIKDAQENVEFWVNRLRPTENLKDIYDHDPDFVSKIRASVTEFNTNNLLADLTDEQSAAFKNLYHFSDEMFADAGEKDIMILLGTSAKGETATFYTYMKATMDFYGDSYAYYYKGHPGYPTAQYVYRQNAIAQLESEGYTLYELDNAIAAEVILYFNPEVYVSGWQSSTFEYYVDNDAYTDATRPTCLIYDLESGEGFNYGDLMAGYMTVLPDATATFDDIALNAEHDYCVIRYNNTETNEIMMAEYNKHEIAIYNATLGEIKYYKSTGENTWKQVDAAGQDILPA